MSYLDTPRFHFGGSFYAGPSTINNVTQNFIPDEGTPGNPALQKLWNPNGVALCFVRDCQVHSLVDADGTASVAVDPPTGYQTSSDPFLTAKINSQNPYSEFGVKFDDVPFSVPKIVDLDPDQQSRSAVYGMYLLFQMGDDVEHSPGFYGRLTVPCIRNLAIRALSDVPGSFKMGCAWQGSLQDVKWIGDVSNSPFLSKLKATIESGGDHTGNLSVKLNVDLHRNTPSYQTTDYDMFCYGRCMGSVGPELVGDPDGFVPGRMLYVPSNAHGIPPFGSAPFIVKDVGGTPTLTADLGNAVMLDIQKSVSPTTGDVSFTGYGELVSPSGYVFGMQDGETFTALNQGAVSFDGTNRTADNLWKRTVCQVNSGVVTVPLTADEAARLSPGSANPLPITVQLNDRNFLAEDSEGYYIDVLQPVSRLEQGISTTNPPSDNWYKLIGPDVVQYLVLKFGQRIVNQPFDLGLFTECTVWKMNRDGDWNPSTSRNADIDIQVTPNTDANGLITMTLSLKTEQMVLSEPRQGLHSRMNFVDSNRAIGDNQQGIANPPSSVLVWQAFTPPDTVTWDDLQPILAEYAKIYPGMKDKLDISDESLVTGSFRGAMIGHMNADPSSPAFMPVTRDLTPTRMGMIVNYLKGLS